MNILKTASMIVLLTLVGRLLGFFRNVYISDQYGTGMEADAFTIAVNIPMTLFLVVPGAINAVLIPTLRGILERADERKARGLYQKLLTIVLLSFLLLAIAGVLCSNQIAWLFGLTGEKAQITAGLLQWMWPSAIFIGLTGLWSSVCNTHQHFFTPTLGTVANGAIVIIAMYLLVPYYGVNGLAIATTLGYIAACVTMIPTMSRFGYRHRFAFGWTEDEAMRGMGERVVPILIGATISQATTFLERGFAASLGDGKIAALGYANTIVQMPMAIFVGAFTLPLFPLLASYVKRGEMTQMKGVLQKGLSYLFILLLPVTVGLILYGEEIVKLVYMRGQFDQAAVELTVWGMIFYSVGLYFLAARDLLTRAFYALENTRTPVTIGVVGIVVYIVAVWITMPALGHGGVALSASISALSQSLLLFLALWRKIGSPVSIGFLATTGKVAIACVVMGLAIYYSNQWLNILPLALHLLIGIGGAAVLYFGVLLAAKEPLVREVLAKLMKRTRSVRGQ